VCQILLWQEGGFGCIRKKARNAPGRSLRGWRIAVPRGREVAPQSAVCYAQRAISVAFQGAAGACHEIQSPN
jgi:hypothetical protein